MTFIPTSPSLTQNRDAVHGAVYATPLAKCEQDIMAAALKNQSDFIFLMMERGYLHQVSDEEGLRSELAKGAASAYIGFDCTAPSLHVGSLIGIMMLRWFQKCGHKPIVLLGGGTTKVGDPSGKDESRKMLSQADIDANKAGIGTVFSKFLSFGEGKSDALVVDNDEWLSSLKYIDFLRDYGPHFTINRMLTFDSVKLRLEREQPLTFLEFNYMLLQAYDFLELSRRHGTVLQMGGSDQWGNIVNGIELGRRVDGRNLFGLTTALLTTSSGAKMGKSVKGAVWLNPEMLSPFEYWQFWRNTEDGDVGRFLRLFTELPMDEIARLEALQGAEINDAKKTLATEATAMLHGRSAAEAAEMTARKAFEEGAAAEGLPTIEIPRSDLDAGVGILNIAVQAKLVASTGEARRQIKGGALRVNDRTITDERATISAGDLTDDGVVKISLGKKRHILVRPI